MTQKMSNKYAEFNTLATLAQNPSLIVDIDDIKISFNDFSNKYYGEIYQTIKELYCNNTSVETASIHNKAQELGFSFIKKDKIKNNINKLFTVKIDVNNINLYTEIIKDLSFKRQLINLLHSSINKLENTDGTLNSLEVVEGGLYDFVLKNIKEEEIVKLSDDVENTLAFMAEDPIRGLTTGFDTLDNALGGGCRPGSLTLLCGRAGKGKSLLAMHAAISNAMKGFPVLYLDNELGKEIQIVRFVGAMANIPFQALENGSWQKNGRYVERYKKIRKKLENLPLYFVDATGMNHNGIISSIRRFVNRHVKFNKNGQYNKSLVIFDYFRMDRSQSSSHEKEYEKLGKFAAQMHDVAQQYKVSLIGTAQLNREMEIAGSDRMTHPADSVVYFSNKSRQEMLMDENEGTHKFIVAKSRFGAGIEFNEYIGFKAEKDRGVFVDTGIGKFIEDSDD